MNNKLKQIRLPPKHEWIAHRPEHLPTDMQRHVSRSRNDIMALITC